MYIRLTGRRYKYVRLTRQTLGLILKPEEAVLALITARALRVVRAANTRRVIGGAA